MIVKIKNILFFDNAAATPEPDPEAQGGGLTPGVFWNQDW